MALGQVAQGVLGFHPVSNLRQLNPHNLHTDSVVK